MNNWYLNYEVRDSHSDYLLALRSVAQTTIKRDTSIERMVNEVSSKNIETIIRKLVSFKSRHTLSYTTNTTGSGVAGN